ncbi:hypothetical protein J2Z64_003932 [Oceanobacillus polygoni]|uniref:Uncharacterized protein n=1 Tax=Oceanobacillus polygoni TaxID=1235259 RepID=A0A9X1CKL4_9BACI|nr:hypothetical protein [Oceanobacillus polygoni]
MLDKKIAYYLKKVAEYTSIHPSKKRKSNRHERLLLYKKILHEKIKEMKTFY